MSDNSKNGSVLVVGGGIAGIQASLDLADSGYKVYMLESKTAIGGHMAQLDKTFPTNDCAMCTISPRLVMAGLHRNIEIITNAELKKLDGQAGNFQATVNVKPNYIDLEKCTGCGLCAAECPVSVPDEYNEGLCDRKAISKLYPQAVPNKFAITKKGVAPCYDACPVHGDPSGYVALTAQGRYQEAIDLVLERNPFPAICGRICHHPCETACSRAAFDEPLSIAYIKRFLADWNLTHGKGVDAEAKKAIKENGKRVAIVGAGPAGLTAALELRKLGYEPVIFEAQPVAGGMMTLGIPAYRLPLDIIQKEIHDVLDYGVKIKTNSPVKSESDIDKFFKDGFASVFLSVGSHRSRKLGLPGEDMPGILPGVDFLREVRLGSRTSVRKKVVVLGGGNVALDCARSALRMGAKAVDIVCLEEYEKMPAHRNEIEWAEKEGIKVHACLATQKIIEKNGAFGGLQTIKVKKMAFVEGKLQLETVEGTESEISGDELIVAIGQQPEVSFLKDSNRIKLTRRGTFEVDEKSFMTSWKGVFAGGDSVRGAASVIEAVADGRRVAQAMDAFIMGRPLELEPYNQPVVEVTKDELKRKKEKEKAREVMPELDVAERVKSFAEVDKGFTEEQVLKEAQRCLYCAVCSNCRRCETVCEAHALKYDDVPKDRKIDVGAVILAPGFELFDSKKRAEYGYKRFPNVLSAMDYERILSASGPTEGHVRRISDGKTPARIAFIQCVGSRDQENTYCSSVCCTYALKQAIITREHYKETSCSIFAMDIRAFGKGFDEYYERAKKDYGVKIVHTRPSSVRQDFKTNNLFLQFTEDGKNWVEEEFDLVVLAAGLCQDERSVAIAGAAGIDLNKFKFAVSRDFEPALSTREGVYIAGAYEEPKDIPETVTQASAAAAHAMELLADVRGSQVQDKVYPEERDVSGEAPRIGVFVCHCGSNIGGIIDCERVAKYAAGLKDVVTTDHLLYSCSPDGLKGIRDKIAEFKLNRVVVASCTPRTHEPLFQENLRESGLNPYLFEMANIRDQCTWVHANMGQVTEDKAIDLVRMAVGRARTIEALTSQTYVPKRDAIVVGGGVSGMTAALSIADQGFTVSLVEKADRLGGGALKLNKTVEGRDVAGLVKELGERVNVHEKIHVHLRSEIKECNGFVGEFKSTIRMENGNGAVQDIEVEHGVAVIATGANELKPAEYLYGSDKRVVTQHELEAMIKDGKLPADMGEVVMIQCVGSREPDRMVCSRVCCTEAIKNAIAIKKLNPDIKISILYRDLRTYGFKEDYYTQARELGVLFFRYEVDKKPEVKQGADGGLVVSVKDLNSTMDMSFPPDMLVLSAGMVTPPEAEKVSLAFKVPLNAFGFFLEAHMKLRPVDFASDGYFLCGTCHSPKFIRESLTQARAAAARAVSVLSQPEMRISCVISKVDPEKCAACLTCVRTCPYHIPRINEDGVAEIEAAMCHGCGICAAECPGKAISLMHYKDRQVIAKTTALLKETEEMVK